MSKVYEIEATITLEFNFEVDAKSNGDAHNEAAKVLRQHLAFIKKEYDSSEIDIVQVVESEGH